MQILEHARLGDLGRLLDLELLLDLDAGVLLGDGEHGALHERVEHAVLDGARAARVGGAGVEEEYGARLGARVRVAEAEEGEARFGGGDGLCELANGGWGWGFREELDRFLLGVDFLVEKTN